MILLRHHIPAERTRRGITPTEEGDFFMPEWLGQTIAAAILLSFLGLLAAAMHIATK